MKKKMFFLFAVVLVAAFSCKRTDEVNPTPETITQPNDSLKIQGGPPELVPHTFAGLADHPGSADGTGSTARFNHPMGIFTKSDGSLLVADFSNSAIRKIVLGHFAPIDVISTPYHHTEFKPTDVAAITNGAVGVIGDSKASVYYHGTHMTILADFSTFAGIDKEPGNAFFLFGANAYANGSSYLYSIDERILHPTEDILVSPIGKNPYLTITSLSVTNNDNKFFTTLTQVWEYTHSGSEFLILPTIGKPYFTNLTSIIANRDGTKLYVADAGVIKQITRSSSPPTITTLVSNANAYGLTLSLDGRLLYFTSRAHHTVGVVALPL